MKEDLRLYTVVVEGESASGVPFKETTRVAAGNYAGAKTEAARRFPGCRLFNIEIEAVHL